MFSKVDFEDNTWHSTPKKNNPTVSNWNIPSNPVPWCVYWGSGDKVEHIESLEFAIQQRLRKKHLYLTRNKHSYKLKKIIFHTQIVRTWNAENGYPTHRNAPNLNPPKTSTTLAQPLGPVVPFVPEVPAPIAALPVVPPFAAVPRSFPRNF